MRATLLAVLLAVATASSQTHAEFTVSNDKTTFGELSVDQTAHLAFNCNGIAGVMRSTAAPNPKLIVRVDGNDPWVIPTKAKIVYDTNASFVTHLFDLPSDLLWEMIEGVRLTVHWGDADTDQFSLYGFTETFKSLGCIPVNDTTETYL